MKLISVVGARPNFIKIAPFIREIEKHNKSGQVPFIEHTLIHTGQHYDDAMSAAFFKELQIPQADINLGIGSGSHAEQTGKTMIAFEKVLTDIKPDWVIVVGDVNATLSCAIPTKIAGIRLCHIEAGLRSRDMGMPEEINRLVTDRLSDLLLTPDKISLQNLIDEGTPLHKSRFVGNIMIDTLFKQKPVAELLDFSDVISAHQINKTAINFNNFDKYAVVTLHRPSNVDHQQTLTEIVSFLCEVVAKDMHLLWSLHPRTKKNLQQFGLLDIITQTPQLILLNPMGYNEMLKLNMNTAIMLTDSGGLQEECTVLGTPCITMRWNTERPVTLEEHGGTCHLAGNDIQLITKIYHTYKQKARVPVLTELWDGKTAERCLKEILALHF